MPTSKSTQTEPCNPHRITPSPSLTDPLYVAFEDTVAIIEMLLFPVDPDVSTALLDNSSQDFLEDLLDQLIEWGFDICGRSGSLRVIAATLVGHVVGQILENLQDELDKIQMQAMQWHKSSGRVFKLRRGTMQYFSQALVNLRGFVPFICERFGKAQAAAVMTAVDGMAMKPDPADLEEGQIIESIEGEDGTCDGLFTKQASAA